LIGEARKHLGIRLVWVGALAVAVAIALPNVWVSYSLRGRTFCDAVGVPTRDVAIVPGAPTAGRRPTAVLIDRLSLALKLYRNHQVAAILVSGNDTADDPEVTAARLWLIRQGVLEADIISDGSGNRTRSTMERARRIFGVSNAVICTQAVHMSRSLFLAEHAGINSVGLASDRHLSSYSLPKRVEVLTTVLAFVETYTRRSSRQPEFTAQL
jgi:SanA protein